MYNSYTVDVYTAGGYVSATGVWQNIEGAGIGEARVSNDGLIEADAYISVEVEKGDAKAGAQSLGVTQLVTPHGVASAYITNTDYIDVDGTAVAIAGGSAKADATAIADGAGGLQFITSDADGTAKIHNTGTIEVDLEARGKVNFDGADASAIALGAAGVQVVGASDEAVADVYSNGPVFVDIGAYASGTGGFTAEVNRANAIGGGFVQAAGSYWGEVSANVENQGDIDVWVHSRAANSDESDANSYGFGALQLVGSVQGAEGVSATVTNGPDADLEAFGTASAIAEHSADANSYVIGAGQIALNGLRDVSASVSNEGTLLGYSDSYASAGNLTGDVAHADASGSAVKQLVAGANQRGASFSVTNIDDNKADLYGEMAGVAFAWAEANHAYATASAAGAVGIGVSLGNVEGTVDNSGLIDAYSETVAFGQGRAASDASSTGTGQLAIHGGSADLSVDNALGSTIRSQSDSYALGGYNDDPIASKDASAQASAQGIVQDTLYVDLGGTEIYSSAAGIISDFIGTFISLPNSFADFLTGALPYSEGGDVNASVDNHGDVVSHAGAYAYGDHADAQSTSEAISQDISAIGFFANVDIYADSGDLKIGFDGPPVGFAFNDGDYRASVLNTANILASADAYAVGANGGEAYASAEATAIDQHVRATTGDADTYVDNSGTIDASALALAGDWTLGDTAYASATAFAGGIHQDARSSSGDATSFLRNTSSDSIHARAVAYATAFETAVASASAIGVGQEAYSTLGDAYVGTTNSGVIDGYAHASNVGDYDATYGTASAFATGLSQEAGEGTGLADAYLDNSGTIRAESIADSYHEYGGSALATAFGHYAGSNGGRGGLTLDFTNDEDGKIIAKATANDYSENDEGDGDAFAVANWNAGGGWEDDEGPGALQGTIVNAGLISASAYVDATAGYATAMGVVEVSTVNGTSLTNTGVISAFAHGPEAYSTGIAIASYGLLGGAPVGGPQEDLPGTAFINNNGGVIVAGLIADNEPPKAPSVGPGTDDDGEIIHRGNAINTRGFTINGLADYGYDVTYDGASDKVVINLTGGEVGSAGKDYVLGNKLVGPQINKMLQQYGSLGYLYGNLQIQKNDEIRVGPGVTVLDGIVNSDGGLYGDLYVHDDAKLVLVQNRDDGAAGANVDTFRMDDGGTLAVELSPDHGDGDYSQIHTKNAHLDGRFVGVFNAGFYKDLTVYSGLVTTTGTDVNGIHGDFSTVEDNSALLVTSILKTNDNSSADLYVDRLGFDEVAGETKNMRHVGGAIENVYGPGLNRDTPFGNMVANLFTLNDEDYLNFLNQLSGAEYANNLQSVLWSTRAIDRVITQRMECSDDGTYKAASGSDAKVGDNTIAPTSDAISATGCFRPGEANIWMSGYGQLNALSGDKNAPGDDETQYGILFGADYAFNEVLFAGIAGGYFNSQGDFDNWGGRSGASIDYDGLQLAAYGGYDNSTYYLRGIVAYGNYSGDSHRMVNLDGAPVDPSGSPDSNTWSFYGETGYRFAVSSVGAITPFAGLSLASATLDGFTEKDPEGTGAALKIHESDADSVASVLGARFSADMSMGSGVFTPIVSVAWMHEFGDTAQEVSMSFAGAPTGASFKTVGSEVARDSAVVDAGAKVSLSDSLDMGLFYNGQFNADYTSNSLTATLGYKF